MRGLLAISVPSLYLPASLGLFFRVIAFMFAEGTEFLFFYSELYV
jgi:hypothetical protein